MAAAELRKPTLRDMTERLWNAGPQTFAQIQAAIADSGVSAGGVEAILNRLRNAGLVQTAVAAGATVVLAPEPAATATPVGGPEGEGAGGEVTVNLPAIGAAVGAGAEGSDVTQVRCELITVHGRDWFDARALSKGIDLDERINCQF